MSAGSRKRLADSRKLEIKVDDICIQNVSKQKLLGIYIDENLNWSAHIEYLCSNISSKISLLRQLSEYVPTNVQKLFFQSYIMPLIDYGSVIWGSTSTSNLERLLKLQKRAARISLKADLFGKELFILFVASAFRKLSSFYVFSYFPFGFEGGIWDLIVSVPDHCLSFYFSGHRQQTCSVSLVGLLSKAGLCTTKRF